MITEFGGFKLGDRVQHVKGGDPGTVVRFDSNWLKQNPDADIFDIGVIWDEDEENPIQKAAIDWQASNKLIKESGDE